MLRWSARAARRRNRFFRTATLTVDAANRGWTAATCTPFRPRIWALILDTPKNAVLRCFAQGPKSATNIVDSRETKCIFALLAAVANVSIQNISDSLFAFPICRIRIIKVCFFPWKHCQVGEQQFTLPFGMPTDIWLWPTVWGHRCRPPPLRRRRGWRAGVRIKPFHNIHLDAMTPKTPFWAKKNQLTIISIMFWFLMHSPINITCSAARESWQGCMT